jgi:hypothetical protein
MISITLEQLVNSTEGLRELGQKTLKARPAYSVAKILKAAEAEMTSFNDTRMNLIKKYGEKKEDGELNTDENGNVRIAPESLADFNKELQELLDTQVEINANKIRIEDIGDVEFTPAEMAQLDDFIEFDD